MVYAHTDLDIEKQRTAQNLIISGGTIVSTQVLQELANTLNKKFKHSWADVARVLSDVTSNSKLCTNDYDTIIRAADVAARYNYSFYDSLIIASALNNNCSTIFSEDMHNSQLIDGAVKIINPFVHLLM